MSEITDKFTKEEQGHLSYLGSMLGRPNDAEEEEFERMLEAEEKAEARRAKDQGDAKSHLPKSS